MKPSPPQTDPSAPVFAQYARVAPEYDARWAFYIEATTRETFARLPLRAEDRVLDVGCGTGVLLEKIAQAHPRTRITGIDPVPEMLAVARRRLPAHCALIEGRAENLPCEAESFDLVLSCNMFHYLRQPLAALAEMRRVLRPGGSLVITDWCDDYLACRACDWWLRLFDPAHFKVYGRRQFLRLLTEAGWPTAEVERYRINWLWGMMTATATK